MRSCRHLRRVHLHLSCLVLVIVRPVRKLRQVAVVRQHILAWVRVALHDVGSGIGDNLEGKARG
eukprot:scaffold1596_cov302-Pinguiococcus_pyrenoidosus.AAC.16